MDIDFGTSKKTGLGLIAELATVDTPHWFADEYDGIVHMEAVMRAYMPPPSCPWKEMHSDKALSDLAFYGIGQVYVMHKSGWEKERAAQQQVAPGVGQHPQPFAGSLEPGSWQQVLLKGHAACEKIQWDSAVNRRVVSNADGSIDRADVKPSAREIGVYVPRGQYSRLC